MKSMKNYSTDTAEVEEKVGKVEKVKTNLKHQDYLNRLIAVIPKEVWICTVCWSYQCLFALLLVVQFGYTTNSFQKAKGGHICVCWSQ